MPLKDSPGNCCLHLPLKDSLGNCCLHLPLKDHSPDNCCLHMPRKDCSVGNCCLHWLWEINLGCLSTVTVTSVAKEDYSALTVTLCSKNYSITHVHVYHSVRSTWPELCINFYCFSKCHIISDILWNSFILAYVLIWKLISKLWKFWSQKMVKKWLFQKSNFE